MSLSFRKLFVKLAMACIAIIVIGAIGIIITGHSYIFTAIKRTYLAGHITANINDHSEFDTRVIKHSNPQPWPLHETYNLTPLDSELKNYLHSNNTAAFLVAKDGKLISENYFGNYHARSKTNSFSMAKSVLTMLLGIAIEQGIIESLQQPITDFLPEFKSDPFGARATIGQLSNMSSGYAWDEHYYTPFSPTVELMYGDDIEHFLLDGHFSSAPNSVFYYSSASTQLLAIALTRALKESAQAQNLSDYLSRALWQPLGMNDDALWHLDDVGMELAFCCINTNARNFAKLGQLLLQDGRWQSTQLLSKPFVDKMRTPDKSHDYGYSLWINDRTESPFYAFGGHLGQYIIIVPKHRMVIVRLGEFRHDSEHFRDQEIPFYIDKALSLVTPTKNAEHRPE